MRLKLDVDLYAALKADIRTFVAGRVAQFPNHRSALAFPLHTVTLWDVLHNVRRERSTPKLSAQFEAARVLPCDGSAYSVLYNQKGIDDTHIQSALLQINRELAAEEVASYPDAAA